jgi:hypothetical protein
MNLGQYLFGYLQEKGSAELPGFGIFSIQKKSATLDEAEAKLLPLLLKLLLLKIQKFLILIFLNILLKKQAKIFLLFKQKLKKLYNLGLNSYKTKKPFL